MTLTEKVAELRETALSSAPPSERSTVNRLFDWLHEFTTKYEEMSAAIARIEAHVKPDDSARLHAMRSTEERRTPSTIDPPGERG